MKTITIKNLTLQFDDFDEGADRHNALNMVDKINEIIRQRLSMSTPLIFTKDVKDEDIIIE